MGHILRTLLMVCMFCSVIMNQQTLTITSPPQLIQKLETTTLSIKLSPLGIKPHSGTLHGQLQLANPSSACTQVQSVLERQEEEDSDDIFLMADDTQCLESVKARNLASAGAFIAVIKRNINNTLHDKLIDQAHVPVIQLDPKQYDIIKKFIEENPDKPISSLASFENDSTKKKIHMELWVSPTEKKAYDFIANFQNFILNQLDQISFKPRFALHSQTTQKQYIGCLSSGRYCPPQIEYEGKPEGTKIVEQSLRQIIVADINLKNWFSYSSYYASKCLSQDDLWKQQNSQYCSQSAMMSAGISTEKILKEYNRSFLGSRPQVDPNIYLEEQRQAYISEKIKTHPILLINNKQYMLKDGQDLKVRICTMIHPDPSQQTKECQKITKPSYFSVGQIFMGIGILIGIMVLIMVVYKIIIHRKMKQEMKGEVDKTLSQYYRYMQTFEEPDPSAVGKVPLVERNVDTNQIGSIQLSDFESGKQPKDQAKPANQ